MIATSGRLIYHWARGDEIEGNVKKTAFQIAADLRQQLGSLYGSRLNHVVLFGSQARGQASEGSDIDVLVVLEDPVNPHEEISRTIDIVSAISLQHDVLLSCVFVGRSEFIYGGSPLLANIRVEGVPV